MSRSRRSECNECGATLYWIRTAKSGKQHPCNDDLGQHSEPVFDDNGTYIKDGGLGRTSHFGTCPARQNAGATKDPSAGGQLGIDHGTGAVKRRAWELVCQASAQTWSLGQLRALNSDMSRLIGIMGRSGADATSVENTRKIITGIMEAGWSGGRTL